MSYRTLATGVLSAHVSTLLKRSGRIGLGLSAFTPILALANPTGGQVMAGAATISNPNANHTVVKQASQSAIIDWQQFNIGTGQFVQFLQPSSSSVILNRVIGGGGSTILGSLTGNGQVFLINTNGVFFGRGATIDTQGFLASTLDIADSDFMSGNFNFQKSGSDAGIVNQGRIIAHNGGYVVLAGDYANNAGIISAQSGHVVLASGAKSILTLNGNGLVNYAVDQATLSALAGVSNSGKVVADGGTVVMTADVANLLKATVVNNTGLIEAHSMSKSDSGVISLTATGGNIVNAGTLDVSGTRMGTKGGDITLKTDQNTILTDKSRIFAAGIDADGGSVEVSGNKVAVRGALTIGKGGKILLDPNIIELVSASTGTTGSGGLGKTTASSSGTAATKLGVNFIQGQLKTGGTVTISAHSLIEASPDVHSINGTGAGNLHLKVADTNGFILLGGVNISIGDHFTASMWSGSFGQIRAGDIDIKATEIVKFAKATENSKHVLTMPSLLAVGGNLEVDAEHIAMTSGSTNPAAILLMETEGGSLKLNADLGTVADPIPFAFFIGGSIKMSGHDIHAKGPVVLMAVGGLGGPGQISVANIDASGTVELNAYGGAIVAGDITTTKGDIDVTASTSFSDPATRGDVTVGRIDAASGAVKITDTGHHVILGDSGSAGSAIFADKGISVTGKRIDYVGSGALKIQSQTGGITLHGALSSSGTGGGGVTGDLDLTALDGTVSLDHSVYAYGGIAIDAKALTYTGKDAFSIGALGGDLTLDAQIGTSTAALKHSVKLYSLGGEITVSRSIYLGTVSKVGQTLTLQQDHTGGTAEQGIVVAGNGVTLSAKGSIDMTADNIRIGEASGAVSVIAGRKLDLAASSHFTTSHGGTGGTLDILGGNVTNGGVRSVLLQAGGDINLTGRDINIEAGQAMADAGTHKAVTANAGVTVKSGGNLTISGSGSFNEVTIKGGQATAGAGLVDSISQTAKVSANVSISAGKALSIGAQQIHISAGDGHAEANAGTKMVTLASADANVSLKAAGKVTLSGGHSDATTGVYIDTAAHSVGGTEIGVSATGGGNATAIIHADVSIVGGRALAISGNTVQIDAADKVGTASSLAATRVNAQGTKSVANLTVTGNTTLTGGISGMTLFGTGSVEAGVRVHGGVEAAKGVSILASGQSAAASFNAQAVVNIDTALDAGTISIRGVKDVDLSAGGSAALGAVVNAAAKGHAKLSTSTGISILAQNLFVSANTSSDHGRIAVKGGSKLGGSIDEHTATGGSATVVGSARVDVTVTGEAIVGAPVIDVDAGDGVADPVAAGSITATGKASKVKFTADAGVAFTAGGTLEFNVGGISGTAFTNPAYHVSLQGGDSLAKGLTVTAANGATAVVNALAGIDMKTGSSFSGSFVLFAPSVHIAAGSGDGAGMHASAARGASGAGKVTAAVDGSINITATATQLVGIINTRITGGSHAASGADLVATGKGAKVTLTDLTSTHITVKKLIKGAPSGHLFSFHGGDSVGVGAIGSAQGGVVDMTADAGVAMKGGSFTGTDFGSLTLRGGDSLAKSADITATSAGSAKASMSATLSLTMTGALNLAQKLLHPNAPIIAGGAHLRQGATVTDSGGLHASLVTGADMQISAKTISVSDAADLTVGANTSAGAVDMSARGALTLTGKNVVLQGLMNLSADDKNTKTTTDVLTIKATATGASTGTVWIAPVARSADGSINNSITLHAGEDVDLNGMAVEISPEAQAKASGSVATATATANVTITAGNDVNITGDDALAHEGVAIRPNHVTASVASDTGGVISATATANVTITAGHDINLTGTIVEFTGQGDRVNAATAASGQKAAANVSAVVNLNAKHNIALTGGSSGAYVLGGVSAAQKAQILAGQSGASAAATLHADVGLTAGSGIKVKGNIVELNVANDLVGRTTSSHFSTGCSCSVKSYHAALVSAAAGAKASLTASADVKIRAGAGGITIAGGTNSADKAVIIAAGEHAGIGMQVMAAAGGSAVANLDTSLTITDTKGAVVIKSPEGVHIAGADFAAEAATVSAEGNAVTAKLNINGALTVSAAKLNISSSAIAVLHPLTFVRAGFSDAVGALVQASNGSHGSATLDVSTGVAFTAVGGITVAARHFEMTGGYKAAGASASGHDTKVIGAGASDKLGLEVDGGVSWTAGSNITFSKAGASTSLTAGSHNGSHLIASLGGAANPATSLSVTLTTGVVLNAGGAISAKDQANVLLAGGSHAGSHQYIAAQGGAVTVTDSSTLSVNGTKGVAFSIAASSNNLDVFGGLSAGRAANITASNAATVQFNVKTSVSMTAAAGTISLLDAVVGKDITINGGRHAAQGAEITANSSAVVAMNVDGSVKLQKAQAINVVAGGDLLIGGGDITDLSDSSAGILMNGNATPQLSANASVTLSATGALKLKSGTQMTIRGGVFPPQLELVSFGGSVSVNYTGSVSISGKTLTITPGVDPLSVQSLPTLCSSEVCEVGTVTFKKAGHIVLSPVSIGLGSLQQHALVMSLAPTLAAPQASMLPTSFTPARVVPDFGSAACEVTLLKADGSHCRLIY